MKFAYGAGAVIVLTTVVFFAVHERLEKNSDSIAPASSGMAGKLAGSAAVSQSPDYPTPVQKQSGSAQKSGERVTTLPLEELLARNHLSDAFKERIRRNVAAIQRGEPVAEPGSVPGLDKRIDALKSHFKSLDDVVKTGLTRPPSDVSKTSLAQGALIGAHVDGTHLPAGWTGLGRVFRDPVLGPVILTEADLNADNRAQSLMPTEAINIQIRGNPGELAMLSDPRSGLSMTKLTWVDKGAGVSYEMLAQGIDEATKQALGRIAESIEP